MRIDIPNDANHALTGKLIALRLRELGFAYPQDILSTALRYATGQQTQADELAAKDSER